MSWATNAFWQDCGIVFSDKTNTNNTKNTNYITAEENDAINAIYRQIRKIEKILYGPMHKKLYAYLKNRNDNTAKNTWYAVRPTCYALRNKRQTLIKQAGDINEQAKERLKKRS